MSAIWATVYWREHSRATGWTLLDVRTPDEHKTVRASGARTASAACNLQFPESAGDLHAARSYSLSSLVGSTVQPQGHRASSPTIMPRRSAAEIPWGRAGPALAPGPGRALVVPHLRLRDSAELADHLPLVQDHVC